VRPECSLNRWTVGVRHIGCGDSSAITPRANRHHPRRHHHRPPPKPPHTSPDVQKHPSSYPTTDATNTYSFIPSALHPVVVQHFTTPAPAPPALGCKTFCKTVRPPTPPPPPPRHDPLSLHPSPIEKHTRTLLQPHCTRPNGTPILFWRTDIARRERDRQSEREREIERAREKL